MELVVRINLDNAAFDDFPMTEAGRILRQLADDLETGEAIHLPGLSHRLRDGNGNTVGHAQLTEE